MTSEPAVCFPILLEKKTPPSCQNHLIHERTVKLILPKQIKHREWKCPRSDIKRKSLKEKTSRWERDHRLDLSSSPLKQKQTLLDWGACNEIVSLSFFFVICSKVSTTPCQITSGVKRRQRLAAAVTRMSFTACFLYRGFTWFNLSLRLRPGDGPLSGAVASAAHKLKQDDFSF